MRFFSALLGLALTLTTTTPAAPAPPTQLPSKTLPFPGETFLVAGRPAFLIAAPPAPAGQPKPWVWYAPTLPPYPGAEEKWLIEQLLAAGIALAGIDVGESYGSPAGTQLFTALHTELTTTRGYSTRPVLLGRSRGGLQLLSWASAHPDKVAAFAGIYPVCDLTSYPGLAQAAPAYGLTLAALTATLTTHNPIDRLAPLAAARVPLFAIHGDADKLVPLATNSALLKSRYTALGGTMELIVPPGQGHSLWTGFFQSPELIAFLRRHATR
jgi:alpha-beta hydrolase superfamily lysophospholipase